VFDPEGWAMLLDAVSEVELFVNVFFYVYILAILAYILTSWVQLPYSLRPVQRFLYDACEPYLRLWRRLLPFRVGAFDLSPMVAVFALFAVEQILLAVLDRLH
jgi:uncharacterized protein YggT (Ycf19 family)